MLRSEERRAASFWRGYELDGPGPNAPENPLVDRIMSLYNDGKSKVQIADIYGIDILKVCKIIKSQEKIQNRINAVVERRHTADRKAAIKKRAQNYAELRARLAAGPS